MPKIKVALTARDRAPTYLRKAREFCAAAAATALAGQSDAALLCAVHAAISASDAVTVALRGQRSMDPDHQRAADLLDDIVGTSTEGKAKVQQLRGLLAMKNLVEYEARAVSPKEAADGIKRCERLVAWAQAELSRANLIR